MNQRIQIAVGIGGLLLLAACGSSSTGTTELCKGRMAGDLVVTEIMLDPAGTDTGAEWFEIYNTLGTDIDLKGMVIFTRDTDGSGAKSHTIKAGTIKAQSYFTFGDVRSGALPSYIGYTYADALGSFGNARGVVGIKCGSVTFDEFTWTKAAKADRSRSFDPTAMKTAMNNDDETKWCDATGNVFAGSSIGTPAAENSICQPEAMTGTCLENGVARPIRTAMPGDLIITEIMPNPKVATSTTGEWFEVLATKAVDLNDVTIATPTSDTDVKNMNCIPVAPGEYILFARSSDPFINGNLPPVRLSYSLTLADTMSRLYLRRGDAGIDEAAYNTAGSAGDGKSWQLDPSNLTVGANDDPVNFCLSKKQWDGGFGLDGGVLPTDYGSPGAPNEMCTDGGTIVPDGGMVDAGPPPDAGNPNLCFDPGLNDYRAVVRPMTGDLVITEMMANPNVVADNMGEWFEVLVKTTVDWNGVSVAGNSGVITLDGPNCIRTDAGYLALFANNMDPNANGNIGPLFGSGTFGLNNTNGVLNVFTDGGNIDNVIWTTSTAGRSRQLDVTKQDAVQNDVLTNFCDARLDAGILLADGGAGDRGTPGTPNHTCP